MELCKLACVCNSLRMQIIYNIPIWGATKSPHWPGRKLHDPVTGSNNLEYKKKRSMELLTFTAK